jgi:putative ABC transport system ATP-binding protein
MSVDAMNVVEVSELAKRVDNGGEALTILHEISFSVAAGETVAIVGASGSGKSTLLGLLAGLDQPSSGSVMLAGEALAGLCFSVVSTAAFAECAGKRHAAA